MRGVERASVITPSGLFTYLRLSWSVKRPSSQKKGPLSRGQAQIRARLAHGITRVLLACIMCAASGQVIAGRLCKRKIASLVKAAVRDLAIAVALIKRTGRLENERLTARKRADGTIVNQFHKNATPSCRLYIGNGEGTVRMISNSNGRLHFPRELNVVSWAALATASSDGVDNVS